MALAARFSRTYAEARSKFRDAAAARGIAVDSHPHPSERGAEGEALSMDTVALGPNDAESQLVLSSGVHGVEGFCGSGIQLALLADDALVERIRGGRHRVLLVHAVNAYGFSWCKRVDENNVDLNRNFVDFDRPLPANPGYSALHPILLPDRWPPGRLNAIRFGATFFLNGMRNSHRALARGQHDHPDGVFFAGRSPSWGNAALRAVHRAHGASRRRLLWLDVHSGLGERGHCMKIYMGRDTREEVRVARDVWGQDVVSMFDDDAALTRRDGLVSEAVYGSCPAANYAGIALEYGTVPGFQVLMALRGDAWLRSHPDAPARVRGEIVAASKDAFYVDADDWRRMVWDDARRTVARSLDWLDAS